MAKLTAAQSRRLSAIRAGGNIQPINDVCILALVAAGYIWMEPTAYGMGVAHIATLRRA